MTHNFPSPGPSTCFSARVAKTDAVVADSPTKGSRKQVSRSAFRKICFTPTSHDGTDGDREMQRVIFEIALGLGKTIARSEVSMEQ